MSLSLSPLPFLPSVGTILIPAFTVFSNNFNIIYDNNPGDHHQYLIGKIF